MSRLDRHAGDMHLEVGNVYAADSSAFPRLDAFRRIVAQDGKKLELVRTFKQLDGKPVYYVFRVE